jgi:hypothetical protein
MISPAEPGLIGSTLHLLSLDERAVAQLSWNHVSMEEAG